MVHTLPEKAPRQAGVPFVTRRCSGRSFALAAASAQRPRPSSEHPGARQEAPKLRRTCSLWDRFPSLTCPGVPVFTRMVAEHGGGGLYSTPLPGGRTMGRRRWYQPPEKSRGWKKSAVVFSSCPART